MYDLMEKFIFGFFLILILTIFGWLGYEIYNDNNGPIATWELIPMNYADVTFDNYALVTAIDFSDTSCNHDLKVFKFKGFSSPNKTISEDIYFCEFIAKNRGKTIEFYGEVVDTQYMKIKQMRVIGK